MATAGAFRINPTVAAGDFKIDKDGAGLVNLTSLPIVQPAGSVLVRIALTAAEMNADVVTLVGVDQTVPKEWADFVLTIPTVTAGQLDAPLVLKADGLTYRSLIMEHTEATGGLILTQNTLAGITPYSLIGGIEVNTGLGQRPVSIGGGIWNEKDATEIRFYTGIPGAAKDQGILRMSIDQTGLINLLSGQLKFPATQNSSTNANTLDDYEEGTFTPTLTAATTPATGVTYTTQSGKYTKIGRIVHITDLNIVTSSNGTGGVGPMRLGGLPFTASAYFVSSPLRFSGINLTSGFYSCFMFGQTGTTATLSESSITGSQMLLATGSTDVNAGDITWDNLGPATSVICSFNYSTD